MLANRKDTTTAGKDIDSTLIFMIASIVKGNSVDEVKVYETMARN